MIKSNDSVVALFDRIAPVYDLLNRIISFGQDQRWRRELARRVELAPGQVLLDISVGTGDQALSLKKQESHCRVIGLDPSAKMLEGYRRKDIRAEITLGKAELLPFPDQSFSGAVCSFGVRNFSDRSQALREIHRVLIPGGLWGFLEMSAPQGRLFPKIYALYFKRILPVIGAVFSLTPQAYIYLRDSVYIFPDFQVMKSEHEEAGFQFHFYRPILRGAVGLYLFKKP